MTAEREALEWIANVRVEEQPHVFATGLEAFCGDHMHLRLARTMARAALLGIEGSGNDVDAAWEKRGSPPDRCKCGNPADAEPHPCPYAADVNNDSETLCTCCDECVRQCADDI